MALNTEKQIKSILYNNTEIPLVGGTTNSNIITFEYTPTDNVLTISHDVLIGAGIDTEDKFFKIIGISIFPKNGDVDWFYVSYGGALDKTQFTQSLTHHRCMQDSGALTFYNAPNNDVPYMIALQTTGVNDGTARDKTFIVTLLLSE